MEDCVQNIYDEYVVYDFHDDSGDPCRLVVGADDDDLTLAVLFCGPKFEEAVLIVEDEGDYYFEKYWSFNSKSPHPVQTLDISDAESKPSDKVASMIVSAEKILWD